LMTCVTTPSRLHGASNRVQASFMDAPQSRSYHRTTTYLTEDSGSGSLGLPPKPGSKDQPCPPAT
jgi:hypothetical protein